MLQTFLVLLQKPHFDSKHNSNFLHILPLYIIYDWIVTIMGDIKHEHSTRSMLYSLKKKLSFYTPTLSLPLMAPSPQQLLSSVPEVAVVENSLIDFFSNLAKVKITI